MRPVLLSLTLLSACHLVKVGDGATSSNGISYVGTGNNRARVGPYWGPECVKIGAPTEPIRGGQRDANPTEGRQPNLAHDPADQVLRLVCVDTIMSSFGEPERNTWVIQHHRFDELFFDHFAASQMLVQCLLADSCLRAPHVVRPIHDYQNKLANERAAERRAQPPDVWQHYQAGMMRWYAANVEPAAVQKRLAELPLPPQAIAVYLRLLERARQDVVTFTDNLLPDAKQIFVDVPLEVYARRHAEHQQSASFVTELAVLADKVKDERNAGTAGVSDETIDRLGKLRIAYTKSCRGECTGGTIFGAMTKQLFWAHVSRGDAPAATAEAKILAKLDPTAAQEIGEKQQLLIGEAQGRLGRVKRAREQGIDPDAARSTANGSITDFGTDFGNGRYVYAWHRDYAIHWTSLLPAGQVGPVEGKVAGLDRRGKDVTIRFQDLVSSWQEGTGCYETGRIESISRDGRITYREHCTGSTTKSSRRKVEPVTMAAGEAAGIQPGDEIIGFTSFGPKQERVGGRVWVVRRGQRLVRLRDVPL